ncbi:unnamed protein product, partial [Didymodactylos carnosus]
LSAIVEKNDDWLCPIESRILLWNRNTTDENLKERFDFVLSADCFFFEELHHDFCHTVQYMLKDEGVSINFAPKRAETLEKFLKIAKNYFDCDLYDYYDDCVWQKHIEAKSTNENYSPDIHYPLLVVLRKKTKQI